MRTTTILAGIAILAGFVATGAMMAKAATDEATAADFQRFCMAKFEKADKANKSYVEGKDGWMFLTNGLRNVGVGKFWGDDAVKVSRAAKKKWADPIVGIMDFKEQLDKLGIELILMPVPPKAVVYPDMICEQLKADAKTRAVPRRDTNHQEFYKLLRGKGVNVLDLTDQFIAARKDAQEDTPLYCKTDSHWSPRACEIAAVAIRKQLDGRKWLPASKDSPFAARNDTVEFTGDLEKIARGDTGNKDKLAARMITVSGNDAKVTDTVDSSSPVILMGDSHCLVFHAGGDMLASGCGLADQLAMELKTGIDLIGVKGSGARPARRNLMENARDEKYLGGKKLVIWCLAAREFTEAQGWGKVPIARRPKSAGSK